MIIRIINLALGKSLTFLSQSLKSKFQKFVETTAKYLPIHFSLYIIVSRPRTSELFNECANDDRFSKNSS